MITNKPITLLFRLTIIASLLLTDTRLLFACGPFEEEVIFTYSEHPDYPLEQFAKGELGILESGYDREYLVFAYRYLNNITLSEREAKLITSWWSPPPTDYSDYTESDEDKAINEWLAERSKFSDIWRAPAIRTNYSYLTDGKYFSIDNCYPDAFRTAAKTLKDRRKRYGKWNNLLKEWIITQDQVFTACSSPTRIPSSAPSWVPAIVRDDRNYQIAASHFYNRNYNESENLFGKIARSKKSSWNSLAHLLVARSLIRKGTTAEKPDLAALIKSEEKLKQILDDSTLTEIHPSANKMLKYVEIRTNPVKLSHDLSKALQREITESTEQDLIDFLYLLEDYQSYDAAEKSKSNFKINKPLSTRQDEMIDWILTFQMSGDESIEHSLKRWKETSSLHWLVAAISKIESKDPRTKQLIDAASKLSIDSPAYLHANYHMLRLNIEAGQEKVACKKLDLLLSSKIPMPISTRNHFLYLRTGIARNANEFFKYSQRKIAAVIYDELQDDEKIRGKAGFDTDSIQVMNSALPLHILANAVSNKQLSRNLRRQIAISAFTRAVLLNNDGMTKSLAGYLSILAPEMKAQLKVVIDATNSNDRRHSALYAILKFPGMRPHVDIGMERPETHKQINNLRNNWWCDYEEFEFHSYERSYPPEKKTIVKLPAWLSKNQRKILAHEKNILKSQLYGPSELCKRTIEWAKRNPKDPRMAEALHRAVKSVRYGCRDDYSQKYSKEAFQTLHKLYPNSEWAKKTKYYYGS